MSKPPKEFKRVYRPVSEIIPYENNSKLHPPEQIAALAKMMANGQDQDIVVDRDGVILKGHGRRLTAIHLGWTHAWVLVRHDLWGKASQAERLNDNRVARTNDDQSKLRAEILDIGEPEQLVAFLPKEVAFASADDLGAMNPDVFVDDMDAVLGEQRAATEETKAAAAAGRVPLAKAFGFKDLASAGQVVIARLMAKAEATTGKTGADALVEFAEGLA